MKDVKIQRILNELDFQYISIPTLIWLLPYFFFFLGKFFSSSMSKVF